MPDIYGSHFEYGGISSRKYGLIIANVETSRFTQLAGDIESQTIFNKRGQKKYLIGTDYSDSSLSYEVEIVTDNDRGLPFTQRREVEKWLFNRHDYRKLYFDLEDDVFGDLHELVDGVRKRLYLNCRFINPVKLEYNGGVVGYKVTLEADGNMFHQDAVTKSFAIDNGSESASSIITVDIDTDMDEYVYPKVTVTMGSIGGDIIIANNSDDSSRLTKFVGISAYASITMNGETNYVSGQYYEKFYDRNFIRLLDGENQLTIMGDVASIEFEYSVRRML